MEPNDVFQWILFYIALMFSCFGIGFIFFYFLRKKGWY